MKGLVESNFLLVPAIQALRGGSRAGGRWQRQDRRRGGGAGRRRARCEAKGAWNPTPEVDTRIHWSSPEEGWVGSSSSEDPSSTSQDQTVSSILDDLLNTFNVPLDSHYAFLGIRPDTDLEGIKAAYRKLSKLYHPDTTILPPEDAAKKFLRLQKAYNVLSSVEERQIYDWTLAQQVSIGEGGRSAWSSESEETLQGPGFQTTVVGSSNNEGEYIEFTGQMLAGLFFDGFALLFSILVIVYVAFLKSQ